MNEYTASEYEIYTPTKEEVLEAKEIKDLQDEQEYLNQIKNQYTMKTGVVESVQGNGSFTNEHGTFYSFEYKLDNGDYGTANHKTVEPKYSEGNIS